MEHAERYDSSTPVETGADYAQLYGLLTAQQLSEPKMTDENMPGCLVPMKKLLFLKEHTSTNNTMRKYTFLPFKGTSLNLKFGIKRLFNNILIIPFIQCNSNLIYSQMFVNVDCSMAATPSQQPLQYTTPTPLNCH